MKKFFTVFLLALVITVLLLLIEGQNLVGQMIFGVIILVGVCVWSVVSEVIRIKRERRSLL